LEQALQTASVVALDVELSGGRSIRLCGVVQSLSDRSVELISAMGEERRVPLGRIAHARPVPQRQRVRSNAERLADEDGGTGDVPALGKSGDIPDADHFWGARPSTEVSDE
jgi:hypothetical protein